MLTASTTDARARIPAPSCRRKPSLERRSPPGVDRGMRETALKLVTSAAAMMTLKLSMAAELSLAWVVSRAIHDDVVAWWLPFADECNNNIVNC